MVSMLEIAVGSDWSIGASQKKKSRCRNLYIVQYLALRREKSKYPDAEKHISILSTVWESYRTPQTVDKVPITPIS